MRRFQVLAPTVPCRPPTTAAPRELIGDQRPAIERALEEAAAPGTPGRRPLP